MGITRNTAGSSAPLVTRFSTTTVVDRIATGLAGVLLGVVVDFQLLSNSAAVWMGVPLVLGTCGAVLGWRPLQFVMRTLMR